MKLTFTQADAIRAHAEWGANCGPVTLAMMTGSTLEAVRPHIPAFEARRYTNPTMMLQALRSLGIRFSDHADLNWPKFGLARIQWEGPWTKPGVPLRARYRYTHWVGANASDRHNVGIFDINAMANGSGWCSLQD